MLSRRPSLGRRCGPAGIAGLACLLIVSNLNLLAAPATKPAASTEAKLAEWVAGLDHRTPSVRESATAGLMQLTRADLPALKAVVEKSLPLSPAQSQVLHDVVTHVFLTGEAYERAASGFVGMQMAVTSSSIDDLDIGPQSVIVQSRMPGFAAYRSLLDGDIVLGIDEMPNTPIDSILAFKQAIQNTQPGDLLHFIVLRQGRQIVVPVKVDARPADLDATKMGFDGRKVIDFNLDRMQVAEEYWQKEFARLAGEAYSRAE